MTRGQNLIKILDSVAVNFSFRSRQVGSVAASNFSGLAAKSKKKIAAKKNEILAAKSWFVLTTLVPISKFVP